MNQHLIQFSYFLAAVLFILSLRWLNHPRTARRGVAAGIAGMSAAIIGTLLAPEIVDFKWIGVALVVGTALGIPLSRVALTAVPQRTALSHAFGGLAAGLVGTAKYIMWRQQTQLTTFRTSAIALEVILGFLTFTGSLMAAGKLMEIVPTRPITYRNQNFVNLMLLALAVVAGIYLGFFDPNFWPAYAALVALSLTFGVLLIIPIGGADMPTVISLLNSYAGLSAVAMGFVLSNKLLIIAGALDGSSGFILSVIMCKAMNRSFTNVLFGAFGQVATQQVAKAEHRVRELFDALTKRGVDVKFGIHPVAGRMPGHMNVLLAEADIPYDRLLAMDEINGDFPQTDVALIIGANDVTNPAARSDTSSPIYGMPILDVDKARTVMVIKRSMAAGFAGIENPLYYLEHTLMLFGDAKGFVGNIVRELSAGGHS